MGLMVTWWLLAFFAEVVLLTPMYQPMQHALYKVQALQSPLCVGVLQFATRDSVCIQNAHAIIQQGLTTKSGSNLLRHMGL